MTDELPLFPLGTVLFPGGPLALRVFEARYLDMVRRSLRGQTPFGVVLIRDGAEVGAVAEIAATGTTARIVDFDTLADGLLGITCLGERRFRVVSRRQQPDGLHVATVEELPEPPPCPLPAELGHLGELLRELLAKLGGPYGHVEAHFDEAGWVGNRWAEILPLTAAERLSLLERSDPLARLAQVAAWSVRLERGAQAPAG